jgi:hypothetical protein
MSVTLKPGDLVWWEDGDNSAPLLVADDGVSLEFQFGQKPWHLQDLRNGKTVVELENILNGKAEWTGSGRLYKCYDAQSDLPLADPRLSQ